MFTDFYSTIILENGIYYKIYFGIQSDGEIEILQVYPISQKPKKQKWTSKVINYLKCMFDEKVLFIINLALIFCLVVLNASEFYIACASLSCIYFLLRWIYEHPFSHEISLLFDRNKVKITNFIQLIYNNGKVIFLKTYAFIFDLITMANRAISKSSIFISHAVTMVNSIILKIFTFRFDIISMVNCAILKTRETFTFICDIITMPIRAFLKIYFSTFGIILNVVMIFCLVMLNSSSYYFACTMPSFVYFLLKWIYEHPISREISLLIDGIEVNTIIHFMCDIITLPIRTFLKIYFSLLNVLTWLISLF